MDIDHSFINISTSLYFNRPMASGLCAACYYAVNYEEYLEKRIEEKENRGRCHLFS